MKLLVTGGAGFIGSNFIYYMQKTHPDYKIVNLDLLTYAGNLDSLKEAEKSPNYRFVHGDIADSALVTELFEKVRAPAPEDVEKYLSCSHDLEPEPTEPVTEPATEPVTEPVTEPEPTEEPELAPEEPSAPSLILIAILCALAGAAVGAGVVILVQKKKQSAPQTEEM